MNTGNIIHQFIHDVSKQVSQVHELETNASNDEDKRKIAQNCGFRLMGRRTFKSFDILAFVIHALFPLYYGGLIFGVATMQRFYLLLFGEAWYGEKGQHGIISVKANEIERLIHLPRIFLYGCISFGNLWFSASFWTSNNHSYPMWVSIFEVVLKVIIGASVICAIYFLIHWIFSPSTTTKQARPQEKDKAFAPLKENPRCPSIDGEKSVKPTKPIEEISINEIMPMEEDTKEKVSVPQNLTTNKPLSNKDIKWLRSHLERIKDELVQFVDVGECTLVVWNPYSGFEKFNYQVKIGNEYKNYEEETALFKDIASRYGITGKTFFLLRDTVEKIWWNSESHLRIIPTGDYIYHTMITIKLPKPVLFCTDYANIVTLSQPHEKIVIAKLYSNPNLIAECEIAYKEREQQRAIERQQRLEIEEKKKIAEKIKERKRRRDLERLVEQELIDSGELFGEKSHKRPPIPRDVVDAVWRRDGGRCVYCGSTQNLQLDHIIPFSKGGDTCLENLQLLCRSCNIKKSNKIG